MGRLARGTMDALIFLVPIAIGLGGGFAVLFLVAATRGQFDDLDDPPRRMLDAEDSEQPGARLPATGLADRRPPP